MKKVFVIAALFGLVCIGVSAYASTIVYTNDFQGVIGPEWSSQSADVTPLGARKFLGQFCNESVALSLSGLPTHDSITIAFDLFIIRSWDGNRVHWAYGPDIWEASADGANILRTTFLQADPGGEEGYWGQAYPGEYPANEYPAHTGASEVNTLGYLFGGYVQDSVYRINLTFPHSASSLQFACQATGLEGVVEWESWAIDNITVTASTEVVPEPSSLLALGGGILALAGVTRRRR